MIIKLVQRPQILGALQQIPSLKKCSAEQKMSLSSLDISDNELVRSF